MENHDVVDARRSLATRLWQELTGSSDEDTARKLKEWRENHSPGDKTEEEAL